MKYYLQTHKSQNFFKRHRFHIITKNDSLPFFVSFAVGSFFLSFVNYMHYDSNSFYLKINFFFLTLILFDWFFTVNKEAVNGFHTKNVQVGIFKGMILFIVSEIMFFFSIFWSFFNYKINPSLYIECIFPPIGINIIKMNCFPLLNTVFLVYSGLFLMLSIFYLKKGRFYWSFLNLCVTIFLGLLFVLVQYKEYSDSTFSFNDSCYGSVFFLLTGFHGFHVIVGLIFLIICCYRLYLTYKHNSYKYSTSLYMKSFFKMFIFIRMFYDRLDKDLNTTSCEIGSPIKANEKINFTLIKNAMLKYKFTNLMYLFLYGFCLSYLSKTKRGEYFSESKVKSLNLKTLDWKLDEKKKNTVKFSIKNSYLSFDNDKLTIYCNDQKRLLLSYLANTNILKKMFLFEFIHSLKLTKNNDFSGFYKCYHFFIDSIDKSYAISRVPSKSKAFYAWKNLLLWINYNNFEVDEKKGSGWLKRRMEFKFILPFIGFKRDANVGYICASWYWHFVDAIWIFVISVIYSDFLIILLEMEYLHIM